MKRRLISLLTAALLLVSCDAATDPKQVPADQTSVSSSIIGSLITTDPPVTTELPVTTNPPQLTTNPNLTTEIPETTDQSDVTEPDVTDAPSTQTSSSDETTDPTVPDVTTGSVTGSESSETTAEDPAVPQPHVHNWGSWTVTKEATCTAAGSRKRSCSDCGESESEAIKATGHSFGAWETTKEATCTAAGSRKHSCSVCGKSESETIKATGHSFGAWETTKAATCTAAGSRKHTCSVCGKSESETVKATGHKWSSWTVTKEATIREEGEQYRTCSNCQQKETQTIPVYVPTEAEKLAMAREVAQSIADSIGPGSDIDRVGEAAWIVSQYCQRCTYTTEGKDYKQAYGVFIKGEYSCAGATRALGMVLECMGYKWEHANPNQWTHQWCVVEMDGEIGWADGQIGWVGYGEYPYAERIS